MRVMSKDNLGLLKIGIGREQFAATCSLLEELAMLHKIATHVVQ